MASTCPTCQKPAAGRPDNKSYPFCSPRCRAVDLGKWLGEEYRVPTRHQEEVEDEGSPSSGSQNEDDGEHGAESH